MSMHVGLWCSSRSGGYVQTRLFQKTDWSFPYLVDLAQTAEKSGFHFMLVPQRYLSSHGGAYTLESLTTASALAPLTSTLQFITAIHPGIMSPTVTAKMGSTLDYISQGRWNIMVVSGWFQKEMEAYGTWIDHDLRYERSEEFIEVLKGFWKDEFYNFEGQHYHIKDGFLSPKPVSEPLIFQGGSSDAARDMASRQTDWFLMNGSSVEEAEALIQDVSKRTAAQNRRIQFGMNAFLICRSTEREAHHVYEDILNYIDDDEVSAFSKRVKEGAQGMWKSSTKKDMVQFNDGFKSGLIGTPEQIADRIEQYHHVGVNMILLNGMHLKEDIQQFGKEVVPLLKEKGIYHDQPVEKRQLHHEQEHLVY